MNKTDKVSFEDLFLYSPLEIEVEKDDDSITFIVKQKILTEEYKKQKSKLLSSVVKLFLYKDFINSISKNFYKFIQNDILDLNDLNDEDVFHIYISSLSKFVKQIEREKLEMKKENEVIDYKKIIDNKEVLSEILSGEIDNEGGIISFDKLKQKYRDFFSLKKEYVVYNNFEDSIYLLEFINTYKKYYNKIKLVTLNHEYYSKKINFLSNQDDNFLVFLKETSPIKENLKVNDSVFTYNNIRLIDEMVSYSTSTWDKNIIDKIVDFLKSIGINVTDEIKYDIGVLFLSIIKNIISNREAIIIPVPILKYFVLLNQGEPGEGNLVEIETYSSYIYDEYGFIGEEKGIYEIKDNTKYLNSFIFIDIEQSGIQTKGEKDEDNIKEKNLYIENLETENVYKYNFYYTIKSNSLSELYEDKSVEDRYKGSFNEAVIGSFDDNEQIKRKIDNI